MTTITESSVNSEINTTQQPLLAAASEPRHYQRQLFLSSPRESDNKTHYIMI